MGKIRTVHCHGTPWRYVRCRCPVVAAEGALCSELPTLGILVGFPMLRETVPKAVGRNERYDISFL